MTSHRIMLLLRSVQWVLAVRVARGYRTISFEAATIVPGALPWVLLARLYAEAKRAWRAAEILDSKETGGITASRQAEGCRELGRGLVFCKGGPTRRRVDAI